MNMMTLKIRSTKEDKLLCYDKNYQAEGQGSQIVLCSTVTKEENTNVQLPQQAIKRICSDKNCQSTRCY